MHMPNTAADTKLTKMNVFVVKSHPVTICVSVLILNARAAPSGGGGGPTTSLDQMQLTPPSRDVRAATRSWSLHSDYLQCAQETV